MKLSLCFTSADQVEIVIECHTDEERAILEYIRTRPQWRCSSVERPEVMGGYRQRLKELRLTPGLATVQEVEVGR